MGIYWRKSIGLYPKMGVLKEFPAQHYMKTAKLYSDTDEAELQIPYEWVAIHQE